MLQTIRIILRKELHDARGNRWLYLYAGIVALLGIVIAETGLQSGGAITLQVFGRTTATLVNLCLFLAPLVAVTLGTAAISSEREQGTLEQLLAQPLSRTELLLGKYLGLWVALFAATLLGFAPAGIIIGFNSTLEQSVHFLLYPMLSQLLISVMLAIGIFISVRAKSRAQATALGIAIWFVCVLAYDILLLGSLSVISLPSNILAMILFLNPVDASRILAVLTLEPDLYILGPAGAFLVDTFGVTGSALLLFGSLLFWTTVPLLLAIRSFELHTRRYFKPLRFFKLAPVSLAVLLTISLMSCGGDNAKSEANDDSKEAVAPAPFKADVANVEKGHQLYLTTCAPCHGKEGKGDGPAAANLNPKPRDHSNGAYMSKLTDDHIGITIKKGGALFGYPNMPAQPQLKDEEINALIAFVRTLAK
ncbi:MAG TPA: ABC transporter permease subunit [Candidatus Kapabacteria bacterium]|nr:ABC transporter permease subunit [Candidatus Kapabacteria bacterium]